MAAVDQPLTKRICDVAEPSTDDNGRARDAVVWDRGKGAVKGFGLRVSPAGAKSFILMYRAGRGRGAPLRKWTIGAFGSPWTVETARREALRVLGQAAGGADPAGAKAEKRAAVKADVAAKDSVQAAVEEWLRRDQASNRTVAEVKRTMEREVIPPWAKRALGSIRKRDVIELIDGIADRGSPTAANRTLAYVRRFMNWAAGRDMIEANPAQFVEKPGAETARDRVLSDAELVEVWRALDGSTEPFRNGMRLLILTLARRAEIFEAKDTELEAAKSQLLLPAERSKVKEGRAILLSPPALAIVNALPRFADKPWLLTLDGEHPFSNFGHAKADIDKRILAARRKAAEAAAEDVAKVKPMPAWRIHDIRRTAATAMQRMGVRLEVVETILGHVGGSRSGIVAVYQRHKFTNEARAAVDAWGRYIEGLLNPASAKVLTMARRVK